MTTFKLINVDAKSVNYVQAVNKTQAEITAAVMYPKQNVIVYEADQWEVDKLITSHSYPMEGE